MHALRACFYHATQVFLLDLSHDLMCYVYLQTLSDGKLTSLKCPTMADSWINTEIMIILLHRMHCLQELDMSNSREVCNDVCEVITKFASYSLKVCYLPDRISFWYPS